MEPINIPEGNQAVMPYLLLTEADRFLTFTQNVFDARQHGNIHYQPDSKLIMHAEVIINGSTIMFCDSRDGSQDTRSQLFVYVADADESYTRALAAGATSLMGLSDQGYGRTCGIIDPTGIVWWITSVTGK